MGLFGEERKAIVTAAETAKSGIDLALVVSVAAMVVACTAIAYVVVKSHG